MLRLFCNYAVAIVGLFALSPFGSTRSVGQVGSSPSAFSKPELVLQTGQTGQPVLWGSLAFSPNKQLLASGEGDQITLWDVPTGRQLRTLKPGFSGLAPLADLMNHFVLAFSPDGKRLAQYSRGKVVIWEVQTGIVVRIIQIKSAVEAQDAAASTLFSMTGDLLGRMEFSPDGRVLALPGRSLTLWDVSSGEMLRSFPPCQGFSFSGTRQLLLLKFSRRGGIRAVFTDIDTGREIHGVDLADRDFGTGEATIIHSPEGHWFAISCGWKNISRWDITGGNERKLLSRESIPVGGLQSTFSPDGRFAALNSESGVRIVDLATQRELLTLEPAGHSRQPNLSAMARTTEFSADGRLFASTESNGRLSVWDTSTGTKVADFYNHVNRSRHLAFEPDGRHLVSGWTRWDLESGGGSAVFSNSANSLDFIASSAELLAYRGAKGGTILVRDRGTGDILHTLSVQSDVLSWGTAISPNSRLLASVYVANMLNSSATSLISKPSKVQQKQDKDLLREYSKGKLTSSEFSERLTPLPPAARDEITHEMVIWDLASERQVQILPLAPVGSKLSDGGTAQFTSDGKYLVYGAIDGSIQVWEVKSWKEISRITLAGSDQQSDFRFGDFARNQIRSIEVSPDGRLVAAATNEEKADVEPEAQKIQEPQRAKGEKTSPLATGIPGSGTLTSRANIRAGAKSASNKVPSPKITSSGSVEVFDLQTGNRVASLPGHNEGVICVAFSADGKTLASGGGDGVIKVWDLAGQKLNRTLTGGAAGADALAFSPDGALLVSSTADGSVDLWDLEEGRKLVSLISLGDGSEWLQVTPDGLFDGSPAAWREIQWRFSGNTFDVAPVEMFFNEYFYPGLLSDLVAGKRPLAPAKLEDKDRRQPRLAIERADASSSGAVAASRKLKLRIKIVDAPAGAEDVRLFRNGSLVKVWHGDVLQGRSSVSLDSEISISAGENRLSAYAFNHDNIKSEDATLSVAGAESLRRRGEVDVLAIGINRYADADYNLKFAVDDARAFGEVLRQNETSLQQFDRINVVPIFDDAATKANILSALKDLAAKAQPEDVVFIFIASHGTANQGHFYVVPHDIGYSGSRTNLDSNALQTILNHSVSDRDLEQAFESLDAGRLLLVLDACNSGQALEAEEKRQGPMNSKGLAQLAYEKGMYVLTASQSYQAAQEASEFGHGLLTYALVVEGLEKGAADFAPKDGQIFAREWLSYASKRVPEIQFDKMQQFRDMQRNFSFTEGSQSSGSQQPRLFYRRELEENAWVISRQ